MTSFIIYTLLFIAYFLSTYEVKIAAGEYVAPLYIIGFSLVYFMAIFRLIFIKRSIRYLKGKEFLMLVIVALLPIIFSVLWKQVDSSGLRTAILFFILIWFGFDLGNSTNHKGMNQLLVWLIVLSTTLSVIGLFTLFGPFSISVFNFDSYNGRVSGWMRSPNHFSSISGIGLVITLYKLLYTRNSYGVNFLYFVLLAIIAMGIILSGSRGGMIGVIIALFLLFIGIPSTKGKWLFTVTAVALSIIVSLNFEKFLERFGISRTAYNESVLRSDQEVGEDARFLIWNRTIENWLNEDAIYIYVGLGRDGGRTMAGRSTHNAFITMMVNYGVVYLVIMLSILFLIFKRCYFLRSYNHAFILFAAILAFIVIRSISNNGIGGLNLQSFLVFYILGLTSSSKLLSGE